MLPKQGDEARGSRGTVLCFRSRGTILLASFLKMYLAPHVCRVHTLQKNTHLGIFIRQSE
ncbi:hypothetical protein [Bacillus massilinigeriensis]|uniref:hypothetical protein n=1 Tax=Bacillus massilionigeriensis TaxID=1805475 RepID=UPI00096B2E57|nr:hypothetical protein [Bacillus massilionigeriensis]